MFCILFLIFCIQCTMSSARCLLKIILILNPKYCTLYLCPMRMYILSCILSPAFYISCCILNSVFCILPTPSKWIVSSILILHPVSWILHPVSWILYPESCILNPASWILYLASCILNPVSWILYPEFCNLYPAIRILYPELILYLISILF